MIHFFCQHARMWAGKWRRAPNRLCLWEKKRAITALRNSGTALLPPREFTVPLFFILNESSVSQQQQTSTFTHTHRHTQTHNMLFYFIREHPGLVSAAEFIHFQPAASSSCVAPCARCCFSADKISFMEIHVCKLHLFKTLARGGLTTLMGNLFVKKMDESLRRDGGHPCL